MNCGLWDQLEALRWIRTEIHSFGGDPGNVTICGESAGAMSCWALFCSPLAQPFFRKAILMSGALSNVLRCSDARLIGDNFCKVLRVAADADALRTLSAKELLDGQWKLLFATDGAMQFQPCVDDELVLDVPLTMLDRQPELVRDKVILLGSNAHEWMLFSPFPSSLWNRRLSLDAAVKLAHRPLRRNAMNCVFEQDPLLEIRNLLKLIRAEQKLDWWGDVLKAFQTMLVFTAPAYLAAEACVPSVRNVYMYSFAFDAGMLGAAHGMELPLLFGTHNKHWALQRLSGAHRDKVAAESVSNLLIDNFGSFAHTGSPLPSWPSYEVGKKSSTYLIDRHSTQIDGDSPALRIVKDILRRSHRPFGVSTASPKSSLHLERKPLAKSKL